MKRLTMRAEILGDHAHVTFWMNGGNVGTLVMRQPEWIVFAQMLAAGNDASGSPVVMVVQQTGTGS